MKHILVEDLEVGDIFLDGPGYYLLSVLVAPKRIIIRGEPMAFVKAKCIMSPTEFKYNRGIEMGAVYYISLVSHTTVKLLVRDGKEV